MVRTTTLDYQFLLAGYYDDFNGARAIANDDNNPSLTATYDHANTHYGNPMNGEATLNTRYRWSYADRAQSGSYLIATSTNRYLKNTGPAEWLTYDVSRQDPNHWEGRAQLQYPDSHVANKYRFNNSGSDGYLTFCNGHDTSGSYIIPTGDYDSAFGRNKRQPYTIQYYDDGDANSESNAGELDTINPLNVDYMQRAHLTGCWMAERNYDFSHHTTGPGTATETPRLHYMPHRSPSGMPFLCIQTYFSGNAAIVVDSQKRPAIAYDGLLNSRQDNDTFGLRFAIQSLSMGNLLQSYVANSPKLTIQIGFPSSITPTGEKGFLENTNTAAIEWEIDLGASTAANNGLGGTYDYHNQITTWDGSSYDASSLWVDLEFVIDYTNNRFTVYKDGTAIKNTSGTDGPFTMNNNGDTSAAFLPTEMKGWQIIVEEGTNDNNDKHYTLMLDRVGLYQSLTERADGTQMPPVASMNIVSRVNSISTMQLQIDDDPGMNTSTGAVGLRDQDYTHFFNKIFTDTTQSDWSLLLFNGNLNRPLWWGTLEGMSIRQGAKTRTINLNARDPLSLLDRQVPLWDLGQKGLNTNEQGTAYWTRESQDFNSAFYFGAAPLKTLKSTVGIESDDSYAVRTDQRTQIYSAHPIQMYNNEDTFGPNDIENEYEGVGILGFGKRNGASGNTVVYLNGNPGYSASDTVNIINTSAASGSGGYNKDGISPTAVGTMYIQSMRNKGTYDEIQYLEFTAGDLPYVADSAEFIYAGKRHWTGNGAVSDSNSTTMNEYVFYFTSDPELKTGDFFVVPENTKGTSTYANYTAISNAPHRVVAVRKIPNYYTTTTAAGDTQNNYNWYLATEALTSAAANIWVVITNTPINRVGISSVDFGELGEWHQAVANQTGAYDPTPSSVTIDTSGGGISDFYDGSTTDPVTGLATMKTPFKVRKIAYGISGYGRGGIRQGAAYADYFTYTGKSSNDLTGVTGVDSSITNNRIYQTGALSDDYVGIMCKERGQVTPITTSVTDIKERAIHARWMRDLPQSLWFQYHFGIIDKAAHATGFSSLGVTVSPGDSVVQISSTLYSAISQKSGLAEFVNSDGTTDTFIYKGKATAGGNYYLIGCAYISQSHLASSTINILTTSDSYKHCWVLWSDMRNDGRADADGGKRKQQFGIIEPGVDNYEIDLFYTDQLDENGNPDVFTDLKLGSDVDLWEVNAVTDASTGGAWSKPADYSTGATATLANATGNVRLTVTAGHGVVANDYIHIFNSTLHDGVYEVAAVTSTTITLGADTYKGTDSGNSGGVHFCKTTGSETDLTQYHDWEEKAGAFLIVDSAKFFNLNTVVNAGKSGQDAGGRTDLGDYVTNGLGDVALMDSYYREAISNYKHVTAPYNNNSNQFRILCDFSTEDTTINTGDQHILIGSDSEDFPYTGIGRVVGFAGNAGSNQTQTVNYILWTDSLMTEFSGAGSIVHDTTNKEYILTVSGGDFRNLIPYTVSVGLFNRGKTLPYVKNTTTGETSIVTQISSTSGSSPTIAQYDKIHFAANDHSYISRYPNIAGFSSFAAGNTWEVPKQLIGVFGTSLSSQQNLTTYSPSQIETAIQEEYGRNAGGYSSGSYTYPQINFPTMTVSSNPNSGQYSSIHVLNCVTSHNLGRVQMRIKGFVEAPNVGTYYESDKMRMLWNAGLMKTWLPRTRISAIHDIANVPNTTQMTTDGTTDANTQDDYGSVLNTRSKTIFGIVKAAQTNSGVGRTLGLPLNFNFMVGRDGRIEFRPSYNLGYAFDRSNLMISDLNTSTGDRITHVRTYFKGGTAFADFPDPSLADTTRWKILEHPEVINHSEAYSLSKQEYERSKKSRLSITAEPIRSAAEYDKMLSGGKFGYIADTHRVLDHNDGTYSYDWAHVAAGFTPFPGMVNAMDGNLRTSTDIYSRYGQSAPYTSITASGAADITWDDQYYFYGANSVSYAMQIVHIPQDMPENSDTTNNELRVFVGLKPSQSGTDIDNAEFTLLLVDYEFSNAATANGYTSTTVASLTATSRGISAKNVKNSGFYQMDVPSSYSSTLNSAGAQIVVSFNAEYCRALLRHRCGDPTASSDILENAHGLTGVGTGIITGGNVNSIFPLGGRKYSEFGDFAYGRSEWYAPRLHVVPDVKFVPGGQVTYTDKGLDLASEVLYTQGVTWRVNGQQTEKVTLQLERDESFSATGVLPYIASMGISPRSGTYEGRGWLIPDTQGPGNPSGVPPDIGPLPSDPHNPLPGLPTGGLTPGSPSGGAGASAPMQTNFNNLTAGSYGNLKGRMNLDSDQFSNQGSFGILGQKKPGPTPGSMRPSSGESMNIGPHIGAATKTSDGVTLPGIGSSDNTGTSQNGIQGITEVPIDVMNNEINVTAVVSCGANSELTTTGVSSQTAIISVTVKCLETNEQKTNTIAIPLNTDKQMIELLPTCLLDGASTYGNNIEVTVTRDPGSGEDTANYRTVKIHSIQTLFKRSAFMTKGLGSQFSSFS